MLFSGGVLLNPLNLFCGLAIQALFMRVRRLVFRHCYSADSEVVGFAVSDASTVLHYAFDVLPLISAALFLLLFAPLFEEVEAFTAGQLALLVVVLGACAKWWWLPPGARCARGAVLPLAPPPARSVSPSVGWQQQGGGGGGGGGGGCGGARGESGGESGGGGGGGDGGETGEGSPAAKHPTEGEGQPAARHCRHRKAIADLVGEGEGPPDTPPASAAPEHTMSWRQQAVASLTGSGPVRPPHEREGTDRHREGIATIEKFASWRAPGGKFSSTGTYPSESERAGVGQAAPRASTGKHASWSEYSSSY